MSNISACPSLAHECPGDSLAAPAEVGQGVGTSCAMQAFPASAADQRKCKAAEVLQSMLARVDGGSPEYHALIVAIVALTPKVQA